MAKIIALIFMSIIFFLCLTGDEDRRAVLVHNSRQEIDACKGKLKLELIRVWGGDKEEDENKFFKTPKDITTDKNKRLVYICDQHAHCIKVFKDSAEYIRTIGQKGKGPGDTYAPSTIALSPGGDLVVYEYGGNRIQRFGPDAKSKRIIETDISTRWVTVTSKDELVIYDPDKTFTSRKLVSICDNKGKIIREIGRYQDKSSIADESDKLIFSIDESDNIYAAYKCTPVIRRYSPGGRLMLAIIFEPPFKIPPVEIRLNAAGDELELVESGNSAETGRVNQNKGGVVIQKVKKEGIRRIRLFEGIGIDSQNRVYIVTRKRLLTEKEALATGVGWTPDFMMRENIDFNIVDRIDAFRLLVFNPEGKIVAEAQLTTFCDGIHISGDRIFIVDGILNQRILEYKMRFENQ